MMNGNAMNHDEAPVYVVIGAAGGIGSILCHRLAAKRTRLVVVGRGEGKIDSLAQELRALPIVLDATSPDQMDQCFTRIVSDYGRIDGVANCVGSLLLKPAHLTSDAEWASTLTTNLTSAFLTVRAATRTASSKITLSMPSRLGRLVR